MLRFGTSKPRNPDETEGFRKGVLKVADASRGKRGMRKVKRSLRLFVLSLLILSVCMAAQAQRRQRAAAGSSEFGPNVSAYLGYLHNEQEVVDDRASRREIAHSYYVHNSNRIYALRQMAMHIARESGNDYLPELEAVSQGELEQLFEEPLPKLTEIQPGEVLEYKLRYIGTIASRGEKFFLFARLDPYEQAELRKKAGANAQTNSHAANAPPVAPATGVRPRRVSAP
ncbi:MAG: hypothetical protein QOC99_264 [Acidobacteriota bacterium]|nr:hypothetical protein [Acidobacteriota bacterium]